MTENAYFRLACPRLRLRLRHRLPTVTLTLNGLCFPMKSLSLSLSLPPSLPVQLSVVVDGKAAPVGNSVESNHTETGPDAESIAWPRLSSPTPSAEETRTNKRKSYFIYFLLMSRPLPLLSVQMVLSQCWGDYRKRQTTEYHRKLAAKQLRGFSAVSKEKVPKS